jgi:DNA-binding GntR family transcriptional regulator
MRQPQAGDSPTRHSELIAAVCSGNPQLASDAVRQHIAVGMERSLDVLQPYFRLRKATGRTFYRSERRVSALH